MTTPRDEEAPGLGDTTNSHEPPAFPSVDGPRDTGPRIDGPSPFTRGSHEQFATPPPAIPVNSTGPAYQADGNARWRWAAAGIATVLVLAVVVGLFLFFGAHQPATPSLVAKYVPANPAAYIEVRLDLPGDQRERLATFMGNFPGFADPASFERKIDETLANVFRSSRTGIDWDADVKPWFGGIFGMFTSSVDPRPEQETGGAVVLSVKDHDALSNLLTSRLSAAGASQDTYDGATLWTNISMDSSRSFSAAITDDALVAGPNVEDVKAAIDAHGGTSQGLADDSYFTGQLSKLSADHLGLFYYDYGALLDTMPMPTGLPSGLGEECMSGLVSGSNLKLLGEVRAEDDHLALRARVQPPRVEGLPELPNRASTLPETMPSNTVAYIEYRSIGQAAGYYINRFLDCLPASDRGDFNSQQIQQMLGTTPDKYLDFVDDVAVGLTLNDSKLSGGLVATVNDENLARARLERVLTGLSFAAGMGGQGITVAEQQHGDATITVINLGDKLAPGTQLPTLSVTVARGRLYMGLDDFVTSSLDQSTSDSFASAPSLQRALNATSHENAGVVYVDLAALRTLAENAMGVTESTRYASDTRPFLEPLGQLVMVARNDAGIYQSDVFLYVE